MNLFNSNSDNRLNFADFLRAIRDMFVAVKKESCSPTAFAVLLVALGGWFLLEILRHRIVLTILVILGTLALASAGIKGRDLFDWMQHVFSLVKIGSSAATQCISVVLSTLLIGSTGILLLGLIGHDSAVRRSATFLNADRLCLV